MKKIIPVFLLILSLDFNIAFAHAQDDLFHPIEIKDGSSISVIDCVAAAFKNSPKIKRKKYELDVAKSNVGIAKSAYFPVISAGVGFYNENNSDSIYYNRHYRELPNVGVSVNKMVWDFGRTTSYIKMEEFYKLGAEYEFMDSLCSTLFDIKHKYYNLLKAKALLQVAENNVEINKNFVKIAKSAPDLATAKLNLSEAEVTALEAQNNYYNARVDLSNSMYLDSQPDYEIQNTPTFDFENDYAYLGSTQVGHLTPALSVQRGGEKTPTPAPCQKTLKQVQGDTLAPTLTLPQKGGNNSTHLPPPTPALPQKGGSEGEKSVQSGGAVKPYEKYVFPFPRENAVQLAYDNSPDLMVLISTKNAMEQSLNYIKKTYYPSLSAGVGYGYNNSNKASNNSLQVGVNLTSEVNLMEHESLSKGAEAQVNLADNEIALFKKDLYYEVKRAFNNFDKSERQIPTARLEAAQALDNLKLVEAKYKSGELNYVALQDARKDYIMAVDGYIDKIYQYNIALIQVEMAMHYHIVDIHHKSEHAMCYHSEELINHLNEVLGCDEHEDNTPKHRKNKKHKEDL